MNLYYKKKYPRLQAQKHMHDAVFIAREVKIHADSSAMIRLATKRSWFIRLWQPDSARGAGLFDFTWHIQSWRQRRYAAVLNASQYGRPVSVTQS